MTGKSLRLHKPPAIDVEKLAKCIQLLASDSDGEQAAAIAAVGRVLLAAGKGFADLATAVEIGFKKPAKAVTTKQRAPARWAPPIPDTGWDASWEAMAWYAHYNRQHLSDRDRGYVYDVLMGQSDDFDCGRVGSGMMAELRNIVAKIKTAQDDRW
jgi:hypothetical protein